MSRITELDPGFNQLVRDFERAIADEDKPCVVDDLPLFAQPSPPRGIDAQPGRSTPGTAGEVSSPHRVGEAPAVPGPLELVAEVQRSLAEAYVAQPHQDKELARVANRIAAAIVAFVAALPPPREFRANELRRWVTAQCGEVAPGSADRILRDLRQRGVVPYRVVDRSKSLYRIEG